MAKPQSKVILLYKLPRNAPTCRSTVHVYAWCKTVALCDEINTHELHKKKLTLGTFSDLLMKYGSYEMTIYQLYITQNI